MNRGRRVLLIHAGVYAAANALLLVMNALTRSSEGAWWFIWPLVSWGIVLAVHAALVLPSNGKTA